MKLSVWPEEDQKNVPGPLTSYNLAQKFSSTSSNDEIKDEENADV